jgi:putative ABC transport system permease protein
MRRGCERRANAGASVETIVTLFTEFKEGLSISWGAIRANKMRSVLTTLGIVIGVVTVTLMGTAIEGLDRAFLKNISVLGADVLYISRFEWFSDSEGGWMTMMKRPEITITQARALEKELTLAQAVAPEVEFGASVQYKRRHSDRVDLIGSTDTYLATSSAGIAQGRFFSPIEVESGRAVCVIGSEVAANLFRQESPLGRRIKIEHREFEVIGILEKQGKLLGLISLDNQIIIPLRQITSFFWGNPDCTIRVKVKQLEQIQEAKEEVVNAMRRIRRLRPNQPNNFSINQQDPLVKMFHKVGGTIAAVGLFVTGLSLFVGGIGIMNIMFVSVAERTREIGIRKAIGAKRRTILIQFLIEAASICLIGGLIALGIAWLLMLAVRMLLPATMSPRIVITAILVSLVTGVLSGFFPAWRAARMNPVDALRNE